ncbi:MAG TPA: hypothetical protein VGQ09_21330 [Chitinophagaceae bacterium]|jgi:hypothetical protein|nr:hypothetical protein [Chitinophagaceae bacterium]
MEKQIKLSANLKTEFHNFLNTHLPAQFSNNLRRMAFEYMHDALAKGMFPTYLNDFLWRLNDLLDLLELAEKEFVE